MGELVSSHHLRAEAVRRSAHRDIPSARDTSWREYFPIIGLVLGLSTLVGVGAYVQKATESPTRVSSAALRNSDDYVLPYMQYCLNAHRCPPEQVPRPTEMQGFPTELPANANALQIATATAVIEQRREISLTWSAANIDAYYQGQYNAIATAKAAKTATPQASQG